MPLHRVDPSALLATGRALAPLRDRVADAEDDLLTTPLLAGDPGLQHDLDHWVDQVVDALRSVAAEAAEQRHALRAVAAEASGAEAGVARSVSTAAREAR